MAARVRQDSCAGRRSQSASQSPRWAFLGHHMLCVLQDQVYSRPGGLASPSWGIPVLPGHFWEPLPFQLSSRTATDPLGSLSTHTETSASITPFPTSSFP